jgi:inosine/xanthosine triphosphate pyrophosphatase family protein
MKLVIGTTNSAKFQRYQAILRQFTALELAALNEFENVPAVNEDGLSAQENARKKAKTYSAAFNLPVLSIDESLIIPAFSADEQPGVNVRRYLGFHATDEQLLDAFLKKVRQIPEAMRFAVWTYAIHLSLPDGREFHDQVELTKGMTTRPSLPIQPGYPLGSLMVDIKSGKPLRELTPEEERQHLADVYEKVTGIIRQAGLA